MKTRRHKVTAIQGSPCTFMARIRVGRELIDPDEVSAIDVIVYDPELGDEDSGTYSSSLNVEDVMTPS